MKNENNKNPLKILLTLSLVCNIAFIGGYILKKTVFTPKSNQTNGSLSMESEERETEHRRRHEKHEIDKLCQSNPAFNKIFQEHCKINFDTLKQVHALRNEVFEKVKSGVESMKEFEEGLAKLNILNAKIEYENVRHFIELRKILGDRKFEQLTERMKKKIDLQQKRMGEFYKYSHREKDKH